MTEKAIKLPKVTYDDIKGKTIIGKRRRITLPQWAVAWIVLIPALFFILLFMFYPIINAFFLAFINDFEWQVGGSSFALGSFFKALGGVECMRDPVTQECIGVEAVLPSFGFNNFAVLFKDADFPKTIVNTFILVVVEVPLTIMVSLLIATFLNNIKALKGLYQTIFFLPYVTNAIALGLVFNILFSHTPGGLINILALKLGGTPINFLSPASYSYAIDGQIVAVSAPASKAIQAVVIVTSAIWNGIAFKILVFMAGLATIDKQYTDAAKIDGSSGFTIWRRITLPLLSPQILYITITSFIGAFKMYTGVMSVYTNTKLASSGFYFGGKSGTDWMPVVGWIYKQMDPSSIYFRNPGIPAAGSLVLLGIIMVITVVQFAVSKRRVHY